MKYNKNRFLLGGQRFKIDKHTIVFGLCTFLIVIYIYYHGNTQSNVLKIVQVDPPISKPVTLQIEKCYLEKHSQFGQNEQLPDPVDIKLRERQFNTTIIPDWYYSRRRQKRIYGGLTADMGWILMNVRYAIENDFNIEFPKHWGHGVNDWEDFFLPIHDEHTSNFSTKLVIENKTNRTLRHEIKMLNKQQQLNKWVPFKQTSDLIAMRTLFTSTFILNKRAREIVDALKYTSGIPSYQSYVGIHVRRGDKIGLEDGPKESEIEVPISSYIDAIECYYKYRPIPSVLFVATDDFSILYEINKKASHLFNRIVTISTDSRLGFSITKYHKKSLLDKWYNTIEMWADLELLAGAETVIGSMESNVLRTVHLMRGNKEPSSTIDIMNYHRNSRTCCETGKWKQNCFFLCNNL